VNDHSLLHRPEDAARLLGLSRATVYRLLADGRIRSVRIGRSRRIPHRAICDYVDTLDFAAGGDHVHATADA
jgi:excisionase family DNA binding protein